MQQTKYYYTPLLFILLKHLLFMNTSDKIKVSKFMDYPTKLIAGRITNSLADKMYNDYNSLISVIEKIESVSVMGKEDISVYSSENIVPVEYIFSVTIRNNQCTIDRDVLPQYHGTTDDFLRLYDFNKQNKLESIKEAIIHFIDWFNEQQQSLTIKF